MKLNKEKLKRIIKEEMEDQLVGNRDEVQHIERMVDRLWRNLMQINATKIEDSFQNIAVAIDELQIPWDKSGKLKDELYDIKYKFDDVVQDLSQYKSLVKSELEGSLNKEENPFGRD